MTHKEQLNFISVIAKVKGIAETDYDDKIYDHILTIFNKLSTAEKRLFLRGLVNICFTVQDKVLLNSSDLDYLRGNIDRRGGGVNSNGYTRRSSDRGEGRTGSAADRKPVAVRQERQEPVKRDEEEDKKLKGFNKTSWKYGLIGVVAAASLLVIETTAFEPEVYEKISGWLLTVMKFLVLL